MILDGWGNGHHDKADVISTVHPEYISAMTEKYPHAQLRTDGENVGLPEGQMGNSEVGHLNIGAGRVVYQDLVKINRACRDNSIMENPSDSGIYALRRDLFAEHDGQHRLAVGFCSRTKNRFSVIWPRNWKAMFFTDSGVQVGLRGDDLHAMDFGRRGVVLLGPLCYLLAAHGLDLLRQRPSLSNILLTAGSTGGL